MTDIQMVLVTVVGVIYVIFGAIIAIADVCNKEITTPRDFYADGYNWFGSWTIFLFRSIAAFPFWILFTIVGLVYKFIRWLFTVGGARA
jgi:uncharacterized membrane protein